MQTRAPARRAQLRASIIAFVVFFNVLGALPTFGTPSAERLERPYERAELQRWSRLFSRFGVQLAPEQLAATYLSLVGGFAQLREWALTPVAGWMALTQTTQRWSLFGTPDEDRYALRISVSSGSGAQVLYESGNPERRWNASLLEYRRIRATYNPTRNGPPPTYAGLCQRLSEQIFATLPDVQSMRCALDKSRIPLPGEATEPVTPDALTQAGHAEEQVIEIARPAE